MASMSRRVLLALATSERFERAVRALPGGEQVAFRHALRYVAGRERGDAFVLARRMAGEGIACSIDLFGEGVSGAAEADRVAEMYVELALALTEAPPATFLSLDLSHIGIDEPGATIRGRLERIAEALPAGARVQIGAEQAQRADQIIEVVLAVARAGLPVSATAQANLKRTPADASRLAEAGVPIRLVKGAYGEDPAIAHAWGEPTDLAFLELAHELHGNGAEVALGTHDPVLREALLHSLPDTGVEMLLGVRPADAHALAARNVPVRIYIPYGEGWFRYAMRRLAESRKR
ncbi:MAG: proline dehydrogenase family protein [Solirubrobacterales bacterium]|nr:proline dehydrogenase family protein [Solirubrobacterales bacterium]MBV9537193.1 proline dehydrogenase family protein [Solirubrobacterales bacterium]